MAADVSAPPRHIRLTSHPGQGTTGAPAIRWGAADPLERGPLVGTTTTVKVKATSAAASATNPELTLTGAFLAELPTNFALGEFATASVTFTGGTYSEVTA